MKFLVLEFPAVDEDYIGGEVYRWATKKKTGIDHDTAIALQAVYDYCMRRKKMPATVEWRWRQLKRFTPDGRFLMGKEEAEGNGIAWILMGLQYKGLVEIVHD